MGDIAQLKAAITDAGITAAAASQGCIVAALAKAGLPVELPPGMDPPETFSLGDAAALAATAQNALAAAHDCASALVELETKFPTV